jgi:hypothetical protein
MTDATLRKAVEIQRAFLLGEVSYQTAQQRLRWTGYRLNDARVTAEVQREDAERRAAAEAAEARRREQDAKVNRYLREQHHQTRGIDIDAF